MAATYSERRSSVSSIGAHSTESPPRLSIDKRHSTDRRSMDRRLSTDSSIRTPLPNIPGVANLPGLSSNSPLAAGSTIPPPTPPKDRLPLPMTPTRKPVLRQKSPLSSEAFSSASAPTPASAMPGAFPTTPQSQTLSPPNRDPYGPTAGPHAGHVNTAFYTSSPSPGDTSSPPSRKNGGRRTSSFRNFLPFKAFRRSYIKSSPDALPKSNTERPSTSLSFRPTTPGADSVVSGDSKSHLGHKLSGTFWRRKSSLGMTEIGGSNEPTEDGSVTVVSGERSPKATSPTSPELKVANGSLANHQSSLYEREDDGHAPESVAYDRPSTPLADDASGSLNKRKASGFWRRASSLTLTTALESERPGWGGGARKQSMDIRGSSTSPISNGGGPDVGSGDEMDNVQSGSTMEVPIVLRRSHSPPPQLPVFVGGGEGLGDLFKNFE